MSNWGDPIWPPPSDDTRDTLWTNLGAILVVVLALVIVVAVGILAGNAR